MSSAASSSGPKSSVPNVFTLAGVTRSPALAKAIDNIMSTDPYFLCAGECRDLLSTVDDAIEGCQRIITEYWRTICQLRTKRNACSKVSHLPHEILEEIFWHTVDRDKNMGSVAMLSLSHVCTRWRSIAHDSDRLWSVIVANAYTSPQLVDMLLRLSGTYLLDIQLRGTHPEPQGRPFTSVAKAGISVHENLRRLFSLLQAEFPRTQILDLLPDSYAVANQFGAVVVRSAPRLQSLTLKLPVESHTDPLPIHSCSALRRLDIACNSLSIVLPLVHPTVTSFKFVYLSNGHSPHDSAGSTLLDALRGLPMLAYLSLSGNFHLRDTFTPVTLPKTLEKLELYGALKDLTWLIRHLDVPRSTKKLDIFCSDTLEKPTASLLEFGRELSTLFQAKLNLNLDAQPATTSSYPVAAISQVNELPGISSFMLRLQAKPTPDSESAEPGGEQREAEYLAIHLRNFEAGSTSEFWASLHLEGVKILEIKDTSRYSHLSRSAFRMCVVAMRSVERLVLLSPQLGSLESFDVVAIGQITDDDAETSDRPQGILLPALQSVTLHDIQMGLSQDLDSYLYQDFLEYSHSRAQRLDFLGEALRACEASRGPLESISFVQCDALTEDDIAGLHLQSPVLIL